MDDHTRECAVHVAIESPQPGIMVVRPQGTLDMHSVPAFHPILEAAVQRAERGLIVALGPVKQLMSHFVGWHDSSISVTDCRIRFSGFASFGSWHCVRFHKRGE